jgi:hypothetical protein
MVDMHWWCVCRSCTATNGCVCCALQASASQSLAANSFTADSACVLLLYYLQQQPQQLVDSGSADDTG